MRAVATGILLGTLAVHAAPALPATGTTLAIAAGALACTALAIRRFARRPVPRSVVGDPVVLALAMLAAFLAAVVLTVVRTEARLDARLPSAWEGRDIVVAGVVASLPQPIERGVRFDLEVESASGPADAVPVPLAGRIALAWYTGRAPEELQRVAPVRAGERWRFTVRLKRPVGHANPHGFDYEVWLLEQDVRATGYVRPRGEATRLDAFAGTPRAWIERARERLRDRIRDAVPDGRHVGVLVALAIGDQRAIAQEDWVVFNRTGVAHLVSISGLHVTMIAALAAWVAAWLWRRHPRLPIRWPAQKAAVVAGLVVATLYCLLAGFGIPAQRTLYMLSVAAVALVLDRFQSPFRVLALALVVVILVDPWAPLSAGFWLSFGAVAILFHAARTARDEGWLVAWARAQGAVTVGLAPLTLALFQQVSLVSPLANAIAIPVVSFVVTPLALLAALVPFDLVAQAAHALVGLLMVPLEVLAELPAAVWTQHAPAPWTVALALVAVAWLLAPRGTPARYAALPLLVPLVLVVPARPATGSAWIDVLDVGQGLAVVVRTEGHALLYDTGPAYGAEADAGERVVVPFLRGEGIHRLDRMIVTHLDTDHSGGAASVTAVVPTGMLVSSLPAGHPAAARPPWHVPCHAGQAWTWDGVRFAMLHPDADAGRDAVRRTNSLSCVLKISAGERSVLLTGDIEAREEAALVARDPTALRAEAVLVPHHGSRTSSTAAFLDAVGARLAIVAAGYRNRFGHPRPDVVARYTDRGVTVLRTDRGGRIRLDLSPVALDAHSFRTTHRRTWRTLPEPP
jgi:competence protein ComEC